MARLLAVLVIGSLPCLPAASFYVSPSGSDTTNDGLTPQAPFQTIQKAADRMGTGDTCYILAGTYRECVVVSDSGVTFQSYGAGTVMIDGTDPVTEWTPAGGSIYSAPMNWTLGDGNQVFQSGVMKPEARWPNAGAGFPWQNSLLSHPTNAELGDWSYVDSAGYDANNQNGWIADAQLPARPNGYWAGASVHIVSGLGWIMQHATVTGSSNRTLTTNDPNGATSSFIFKPGNEYYLTGLKGEMDTAGEWFYEAGRLYYFSSGTPVGVQAKKRLYGFDIRGRSNVTLLHLNFFACTIQTDWGSTNSTFDGLTMRHLGHSQVNSTVFGVSLANGSTLRNSDLGGDSRGLVYLAGNDIRVINNNLHDSGYIPFWDSIVGGYGYRNLVSHNTLSSAGRAIMGSVGRAAIIEFNDMFDAMRLTVDGGILYTYLDAGNTIFRYNLLHDSPGPVGHGGAGVQGFYLDCLNSNWVVHHNIIWGLPGYAMQFNARQNFNMVFNNTCWNTVAGSLVTAGSQDGESGTRICNNLWNSAPKGEFATWGLTDFQSNLHTDPGFVNPATGNFQLSSGSPGINQGTVIDGVTDGFIGSAPDLGALENGASDWTPYAGRQALPPSPDPVYSMPDMEFANRVKDGSFESGALSNYWTTTSGSNAVINTSGSWVTGFQGLSRSGYHAVKFGGGTSELRQTVTGLQPGRRYKLSAGIQTADPSAQVAVGVRNFGFAALEVAVPGGTGGSWEMMTLPFVIGAAGTGAEIYVRVVSSSPDVPVYVDDLCVAPGEDSEDPQPYGMPFVSYPFNETGGSTAYDASPNARNAFLANTAFAHGLHGNALQFSGTGGYGSASTVPSTTGSFTVAFWAKFDNTGIGTPYLASNNNGSWMKKGWLIQANQNRSIGMNIWTKDNSLAADDPPTAVTAWTSPIAEPGVWTHVAFTVDRVNGVLSGYRDGTLCAATNIPAGFADFDTLTGLRLGSPELKGQMDEFQMWDSALPAGAIRAVARADTTLTLRLKLDEKSGATKAWDATGSGHNGSLTSMNTTTSWAGGALQFSSAGYVQCPGTTLSPGGSFTLSFWVKFDEAGTGTPLLASNTNGSNIVKGWFVQASQNRSIGIGLNNGTTALNMWHGQMTSPAGVWTHIAYTIDRENGVVSGYCNGILRTSTTIPAGFGNIDTLLGQRFGSGPAFKGQLADVRLYSRAQGWWEFSQLPKLSAAQPNGLQAFRSAYSLLSDGSQDTETPAGDGVQNLLKFAFNMLGSGPGQTLSLVAPNSAVLTPTGSAGLPLVGVTSGKLQLTYIRRKIASDPGLTYAVQFSNDLGLSDPWAANPSATEVSSSLDTTFERVVVTDSLSNPSCRFVRVRVTAP